MCKLKPFFTGGLYVSSTTDYKAGSLNADCLLVFSYPTDLSHPVTTICMSENFGVLCTAENYYESISK